MHKPVQVELQLDRPQLPTQKYYGPSSQEAAQSYKKGPYRDVFNLILGFPQEASQSYKKGPYSDVFTLILGFSLLPVFFIWPFGLLIYLNFVLLIQGFLSQV